MKDYEQTRDRNRHLTEQRRLEVYTKLPEYGRLDESVGELSVAQAKLLLNGDDEALTRLRFSLKDISRRKKELLVSAGYPVDYLEPVYTCPDCKDTGYIEGDNGLRKKCHCFHQQELDIPVPGAAKTVKIFADAKGSYAPLCKAIELRAG